MEAGDKAAREESRDSRCGAKGGRGDVGGVVLHDTGQAEVGQLAGVPALVVVGHRARL